MTLYIEFVFRVCLSVISGRGEKVMRFNNIWCLK